MVPWRLGHKSEAKSGGKPVGKGLKEASSAFVHPRNPPPEQVPGADQPMVLMTVGPCTVDTEGYRCTCEQGSHVSTTGMVDSNQLCHSCLHPFGVHNEYGESLRCSLALLSQLGA